MAAVGRAVTRLIPLLVAATVGAAVLTVPAPPTQGLAFTGTSQRALAAALLAGLGLALSAVVAAASRGGASLATALAVAATAWLAPEVVAREDAPELARSLAGFVAPALAPALLHAVLAVSRWPRAGARRVLVLAGYAVPMGLSLVHLAVWDPGLDPNCWANCTSNILLLWQQPHLASMTMTALDITTLVVAGLTGVVALLRPSGSTADPRERLLLAIPVAVAALAVAAHAVVRVLKPFETPFDATYVRLFEIRAWTLVLVAVGSTVLVVLDVRRRLVLGRVLRELTEVAQGRSLQELLREATGDRDLVVLYPGPDGAMLDTRGERRPRPGSSGRRVATSLVRGDREVALVVHDAELVGVDELRRATGPAARLAVDNERLRAGLLLGLAELQESRARVVTAGDAKRRELERDLHDGAQHRLLALGHDVRRARDAAGEDDSAIAAALDLAYRDVQAAATELRAVGRGLYPSLLTAEGLEGALWSLSDSAPVPLEIRSVPTERYVETVERTVVAVAVEAVEAVASHGAEHGDGVTLEVDVQEGRLVIEVTGVPGRPPDSLLDRVGAMGGTVGSSPPGRWRAEVPCA